MSKACHREKKIITIITENKYDAYRREESDNLQWVMKVALYGSPWRKWKHDFKKKRMNVTCNESVEHDSENFKKGTNVTCSENGEHDSENLKKKNVCDL